MYDRVTSLRVEADVGLTLYILVFLWWIVSHVFLVCSLGRIRQQLIAAVTVSKPSSTNGFDFRFENLVNRVAPLVQLEYQIH
jgi:hypothetical protein